MCGRFVRVSLLDVIQELFELADIACDVPPSYNITPAQPLAAIVHEGHARRLVSLRWGLIPPWAKDPSIGNRLINARAETLAQKPSFRNAFKRRRCLIVADGFYEWRKTDTRKVPMYIHLRSGQPFGFAGLFERWTSSEGLPIDTCTIITTGPNELMQSIHHRMPVILAREQHALWLDPAVEDERRLLPVLQPYPAAEMDAYDVSRLVNSPTHDSPLCIAPVPQA